MTATTRKSFGRFASKVQEFGGEYTLPIGDLEIHPGSKGGWTVVAPTGEPLVNFADIEEAVAYAKAR